MTDTNVTHGIELEWVGRDGILRKNTVHRTSKNKFIISTTTHYNEESSPPALVSMQLSDEAFYAISSMIMEFALNREEYKISCENI